MFVSWKPAFSNTLMLLAFMMFLLGETKWALSVHSVNIILAISACRITSALLTEKWKINFLISEEVKGITCKVQELQHNELCSYLMYSIHMYRHMYIYDVSTQWLLYMEQRELGTQVLFQMCSADMGTGAKHLFDPMVMFSLWNLKSSMRSTTLPLHRGELPVWRWDWCKNACPYFSVGPTVLWRLHNRSW